MSETMTATSVALDDLVLRLAAAAFDTRIFSVYTNTRRAQNRAVKGQYPHLVVVGKGSQRVEMVGMVETVDTLHDLNAAARRWHALAPLQAAMYLYVPRGLCADVRALCLRETIRISDFRDYWFEGDQLHIAKCFA